MDVDEIKHKIKKEKELGTPYFDMSLDIGISESTLYKFMEYNQYSKRTIKKLEEYLDGIE